MHIIKVDVNTDRTILVNQICNIHIFRNVNVWKDVAIIYGIFNIYSMLMSTST